MGEVSRVTRWRERLRQQGKKAVTVWLSADEELRLKDLALQWHCSPSEIMQHALAQFHPGRPPRLGDDTETQQHNLGNDTDISQIQAWLQAELPGMVRGIVEQLAVEMLTETVAEAFTDTEDEEFPYAADITAADPVTETSHSGVSDVGQMRNSGVSDVLQERDRNASETAIPATYDTGKYYLGKLCPKGHDYEGTGQSLLYRRNKRCLQCDRESAQARRRAKAQQGRRPS
jgi:hypothetical protein